MIQVRKADGSAQAFSEEKVVSSIKHAGIPSDIQNQVLEHVKSKLYENIPTSEIYHHISEFLGKTHLPYAKEKYGLKQAIMALGPSGYPFEDFVSALLVWHGYSTKVRQLLLGNCVNHEIDVIAEKDGRKSMIEAKFHNNVGTKSEVHVTLYTKARFEDLRERHNLDEAWVVTNTKATIDAVTYAQCVGMKVISWSYPDQGSLRDLIESSGLHPITILSTLTQGQKVQLLENHIVMCRDIQKNPELLRQLNLSHDEHNRVLDEVIYICKTESDHA